MRYAVVFSGQGHQHPDMLPWVADDDTVRKICTMLRISDWRAAVIDSAWARRNAHAQVLLTGLAIAAWHQIATRLPAPTAVAGYSVGELAAFCAARVYDASTALDLAHRRAMAMDRCASVTPGGLLAISGAAAGIVEKVCGSLGLAVAIRNGPGAVVVGGPLAALTEAEHAFAASGVRSTRLHVGVASHTPWMQQAADEFMASLCDVTFDRPHTALFSNASGERVLTSADAKQRLAKQIASTVKWEECMEGIQARRVSCVFEIGPGRALARMWNDRYPEVPARSCDDFRSTHSVARWISGCADPDRP